MLLIPGGIASVLEEYNSETAADLHFWLEGLGLFVLRHSELFMAES